MPYPLWSNLYAVEPTTDGGPATRDEVWLAACIKFSHQIERR